MGSTWIVTALVDTPDGNKPACVKVTASTIALALFCAERDHKDKGFTPQSIISAVRLG